LLLLVALVSGAAFYSLAASLRAEREYTAFVHQLASGEQSRVLELRFERGWLRSRATTSLEVGGGAGILFRSAIEGLGATDVRSRVGMGMVNEIEHGLLPLFEWVSGGFQGTPMLARIRSTLELDQESQLALDESIGKLPPLEAQTDLRTAGQADTRFWMRGERLRGRGDGIDGRFLGLQGELAFSEGFRRVSGRVRLPGVEGAGPKRSVGLREMVWEFDLPGGDLPLGRMTLSLGRLELDYTSAGGAPLLFTGVKMQGESQLSAGSFDANLAASAGGVALGSQQWGPGKLRVTLNDVDGRALRRLHRAGLRLQSHRESGDPAQIAVVAVDVLEALPTLLARAPYLSIEQLEVATPHGPLTGSGRLALAAPQQGEGALELGSLLRGEIDVRLPAPVLDAVTDARARGELLSQGADASDAGAFDAKAREQGRAWIASLRQAGSLREDGALVHVQTSWGALPLAPASAPVARTPARAPAKAQAQAPAAAAADVAPPPAAPAPGAEPSAAAPAPAAPAAP
jgi:uncharacterized protein YdgA (DUF945 family)